jgi:polysaccharide biosynthesis protein PslJ
VKPVDVIVRPTVPVVGIRARDTVLPAWPVLALLAGFPVWWLLGLSPFISIILAGVMIVLLLGHRPIIVVPGVWPLFAFVAWVVPCALMLDSPLRLVGYGLRLAQFAAVAVVVLYVVNARPKLTANRLLAGLLVVWLTAVVGGYLGLVWPEVRLTTPVGLLLPGVLTENEYVRDLVFPAFAEVQFPWGATEPFTRPAAPFTYANSWGSAMAILTPVAVAYASRLGSRRARLLVGSALAAAIPPAVATSNRGLFLALAASILYVGTRLALRGNGRALLAVAAATVLGAVVFANAGLWDTIAERQASSDTTSGRAQLYAETFERTLQSPLFGYGAPRPSFESEISVGTQGQIWMLMFSYGFVGLVLFLWFLWGAALRTWRAPGMSNLWLHAALVSTCILVLYYGLDVPQLTTVAVIAALLLRERYRPDLDPPRTVGVRAALA